MKKLKLLSLVASTPLVIIPLASSSCSIIEEYKLDMRYTNVHRYINERSFSICDATLEKDGNWTAIFGTMWLFYHETDENMCDNGYTYYALTNNHVISGFAEDEEKYKSKVYDLYFGFQEDNEAGSENTRINELNVGAQTGAGKNNEFYIFNKNGHKGIFGNDKFIPIFTTYLQAQTGTKQHIYHDMAVIKVDFSTYTVTETDIKKRLDKLNVYANSHSNYLVQFDDYSDTEESKLFCGGFPLVYAYDFEPKDRRYIYPDKTTKFQSPIFENVNADVYSSMSRIITTGKRVANSDEDKVYDANNDYDEQGGLFTPDWIGKPITDKYTKFGGGASGSLAIRASDEDNPETYKATGIYWGGMTSNVGDWYFNPHFTPFKLNFGRNLSNVDYTEVIKQAFFNNYQEKNKPVNYCIYTQ